MYKIKTDQFEGPLDLLLNLIEEQKLDITRFSLAKVADQYLEYISQKDQVTLENLAEFLTIASRLILIKSKALLPNLELSQDEEEEIKDLEYQLAQYKRFKDISKKIGRMYSSSRRGYARELFSGIRSFFYPPVGINAYDLKKTYARILSEIPLIEKLEEEMVREVVTLEEKISEMQKALTHRMETTFSQIAMSAKDKIEVIISFLAMLELVKQRIIHVEQNGLFTEIKLKKTNINE